MKKETTNTILVRDVQVGDKVTLVSELPPYTVTKISSYGTSHHSLIVSFDRILPDGMIEWVFDKLTKLPLAD